MIICQVCKKECNSNRELSLHLKSKHSLTLEEYFLTYLNGKQRYCYCGKKTKFRNINIGYAEYCSVSCCNKNPKRQIQIKAAMQHKYGVNNPSQVEVIKKKKIATLKRNYGVISPLQSEEIRNRVKTTSLIRYGYEHYAKSNESKIRFEETCLKNHGVRRPLQKKEFLDKARQTCQLIYGKKYASQNSEIQRKMSIKGIQNSFFRLLQGNRLREKYEPLFSINEFDGLDNYRKYRWKCKTCDCEFISSADNGHLPRCPICFPKLKGTSRYEKDLYNLFDKYCVNFISNDRTVIFPLELDIYIPSHNLAIEFDGLYWHSEINGNKDKKYHLNKTLMCQEKGIQLLHIFEDEWIYKQEIVKSIIAAKLGFIKNKIFARKCEIKEVPNDEAKLFLFDNHLQGSINGNHLGLYYNDELVSILTYGKSRFNKNYDWEILRFCNKINTIIIGGFSKLLKHLNLYSIITYADLRYSEGSLYSNNGFYFIAQTSPSFFYLDSKYTTRLSRLQFQKHLLEDKLEIFDPNLTAWQNMQLNGYDRIWDCGTTSFCIQSQ